MTLVGYIKRLFGGGGGTPNPTAELEKFPIPKNISRITYIKEKDTLKESEWVIKEKEIGAKVLMPCVQAFLEDLKSEEKRKMIFSFILENYKEADKILGEVVNTIYNDLFVDKDRLSSIIEGRYKLNNTYSDLSIFFFNVLVYGHPLLLTFPDSANRDDSLFPGYSDCLVEFDYDGIPHCDTLRNHVTKCFYLILKMSTELEEAIHSKDPDAILSCLIELADTDIDTNDPIDDFVIEAFHILKDTNLKKFLDLLYDLFLGMRDPRNIIIHLLTLQKESRDTLLVSKCIYFVMQNYDFHFDNFYGSVEAGLTVANLEEETEDKLRFIIHLLNDNTSVNVKYMERVVGRLMSMSLECSSHMTLSILYAVLHILRSNPVLFSFISTGEEIEIHCDSIIEISSIALKIKREASNKHMRVKFVNLTNLNFPMIKEGNI